MVKRADALHKGVAIFCFSLLLQSHSVAQNGGYLDKLARQQTTLKINLNVAKRTFCSNGTVALESVLTFTNVSAQPLVLCKGCIRLGGTYLANSLELLDSREYLYDLSSMGFNLINPQGGSPDKPPFTTLESGEAFQLSLGTSL